MRVGTVLRRREVPPAEVTARGALRTVVGTFGVVLAAAGVEHGIGEILQGAVAPAAVTIESWPDSELFEILAGEPAMTVVPNLALTGVLAILVSLAVAVWAVGFVERRHGGLVLVGLSLLLLLVGGGFGPPLVGVLLGFGATRIGVPPRRPAGATSRLLGRAWPGLLALGVGGYLALFPGMLVAGVFGLESPALVYAFGALAFAGLLLAMASARAHDRTAWPAAG